MMLDVRMLCFHKILIFEGLSLAKMLMWSPLSLIFASIFEDQPFPLHVNLELPRIGQVGNQ